MPKIPKKTPQKTNLFWQEVAQIKNKKYDNDNTTYYCKVCPQNKNGECKLGNMFIGIVKKYANTAGRKAIMDQYLSTLTFFQPRCSSVTNRANAGVEGTSVAMSVSRPRCSTAGSSQVSSSSSVTFRDPMTSRFKTTASIKSEIIYAFTLNLMGKMTTQRSTLGILACVQLVLKHNASKWDWPNWCM